jgi:Leu/Phe-tRNA-protein transferase
MILRLLTAFIIMCPLAAFARLDGDPATVDLEQHEKCLGLLTDGYFHRYVDSGNYRTNSSKSVGWARQWTGPNPGEGVAATLEAFKQTLLWWDYSFTVVKSVEEARALEMKERIPHVYKTAFIISDVDVSHFDTDTPRSVLLPTFTQAFENSRIIEFIDIFDAKGKLVPDRYEVVDVDKANFSRLADLNKIYWHADWRGAHFSFDGWTQLKYRGMLSYDDMFRRNSKGWIENSDIRRGLKRLVEFYQKEGGEIFLNYDFDRSLKLNGDMVRSDGNGKMIANSRYADENIANTARELYRLGKAFSMEGVLPSNKIPANQIGFITGRMLSGDTVYYESGQQDLARALIIAGMVHFKKQHGIGAMDGNVASKFSKQAGSKFVPIEEFHEIFEPLIQEPPPHFEERRGFTLQELLPYPLEDIDKWLEPHGKAVEGSRRAQQARQAMSQQN